MLRCDCHSIPIFSVPKAPEHIVLPNDRFQPPALKSRPFPRFSSTTTTAPFFRMPRVFSKIGFVKFPPFGRRCRPWWRRCKGS